LKGFLVEAGKAQYKSLNIVIGNESADLDSCVSSILLAFLKHYQKN